MVETNRRSRFFLTSHELTSHAQKGIGFLIVTCALTAIIVANISSTYVNFWDSTIGFVSLSRREFVNEFVMSIFFFAAGMELRYEFFHGHLDGKEHRRLPIFCSIGGMITPISFMLIAAFVTKQFSYAYARPIFDAIAIPVGTDTVFALALLSFISRRIPRELRSLVLAIVVIDDVAGLGLLAILKGHIPPTVIAVALGFFVPTAIGHFRIRRFLMYYLTFVVNLFVLPIFALANTGIRVEGIAITTLATAPLFWSLLVAQWIGKTVGVYGAAHIAYKKKWAALPRKAELHHVFVAACSCGIGFTLSLYLAEASLGDRPELHAIAKIAILISTVIAATVAVIFALRIPERIRSSNYQ